MLAGSASDEGFETDNCEIVGQDWWTGDGYPRGLPLVPSWGEAACSPGQERTVAMSKGGGEVRDR